jgi:SAM-dependent methyltransferase
MLEGGCGSASHFNFVGVVKSVGIDISREQLDRNGVIQEKILGDIQTYPLTREGFDIVVCWEVVEHLSRPRDALRNMFSATKPGGVLILSFPNLASFKGIVTKFTPYWFHRWFYRIMKYKASPFPTYFRLAILPKRVIRFAQEHGFSLVFSQIAEGGVTKRVKERFRIIKWMFLLVDGIFRIASGGKCQSLFLDSCALIFVKGEKPAHGADGSSRPVAIAG